MLQVHKKLGNTHLALMYFSWASDLDPKGVNSQIKEAILSPGQDEEEPLGPQSGWLDVVLFFKCLFQFTTFLLFS